MNARVTLALAFVSLIVLLGVGVWAFQALTTDGSATDRDNSGGLFDSFFPFGNPFIPGDDTPLGGNNNGVTEGSAPTLRRISNVPVAGATFYVVSTTSPVHVRYVERETGHIYQTPVDRLESTRLSLTTIPAVREALFTTGSTTIMRVVSDSGAVDNFISTLRTITPDQSLVGSFLPQYDRIAVDKNKTFVGLTESSLGSTLEMRIASGTDPKSVHASVIRSWIPLVAAGKVFVASAPASRLSGSVFEVRGSELIKVVGDAPGLMPMIDAGGTYIAYSTGSGSSLGLSVYDTSTDIEYRAPVGTLIPKCAFIPNAAPLMLCAIPSSIPVGEYPDDWLLGRVHTTDDLWYVDAVNGTVTAAAAFENAGPFDITNLQVSNDGGYALFINKNDGMLWSTTLSPLP
ncbi:MAG: hypothetical protein RLZZ283_40 [Candidatus Parcubacteria bacterium]|jgi:hypothetical protein